MEATATTTRRKTAIGLVLALLAVLLWSANEEPAAAAPALADEAATPVVAQIGDHPDVPHLGIPGTFFAKYDGIDGESQDANHDTWVDVLAIDWGVHKPGGAATSSSRTRTPAQVDDFIMALPYDKAAPKLLEASFKGKVIPKLEVELTRSTEAGRQVYLKYEMTNVMITSYNVNASGNDKGPPTVVVGNTFEEIKVTFTEYDDNGNSKGNVETELKPRG